MTRLFALLVLLLTVSVASISSASLGSASLAAPKSPLGTWHGKLSMKVSDAANAKMTPQQRTQRDSMLKGLTFTLTMKKGGIYTILVGGGPSAPPSNGKWVQKGNKITLTSAQGSGPNKSQVAVLSPSGKVLTIALPKRPDMSGAITFTR